MADEPETHKLQTDPPEGDRAVIDRELARQDRKDRKVGPEDEVRGGTEKPSA